MLRVQELQNWGEGVVPDTRVWLPLGQRGWLSALSLRASKGEKSPGFRGWPSVEPSALQAASALSSRILSGYLN